MKFVCFWVGIIFLVTGCNKISFIEDVYCDKYVYKKQDSSLFTGRLLFGNYRKNGWGQVRATGIMYQYKKGLPVNNWRSYHEGNVLFEGYIMSKANCSSRTMEILEDEVFVIENEIYAKEGENSSQPHRIVLRIYKDTCNIRSDTYYEGLAKSVYKDFAHLDIDFISICVQNGFICLRNFDYDINNGVFKLKNIKE